MCVRVCVWEEEEEKDCRYSADRAKTEKAEAYIGDENDADVTACVYVWGRNGPRKMEKKVLAAYTENKLANFLL